MQVKDLMATRITWVHPALPLREVARKMRALNVGCLPVGESGRLLGIVTDRDIVCRLVADGRDADRTRVHDVMTKDVVWCFDDQDAEEAARLMRDRRLRRLPILDRGRRVVGLLSVADLCGRIADSLFTEAFAAIAGAHPRPAPPRSTAMTG